MSEVLEEVVLWNLKDSKEAARLGFCMLQNDYNEEFTTPFQSIAKNSWFIGHRYKNQDAFKDEDEVIAFIKNNQKKRVCRKALQVYMKWVLRGKPTLGDDNTDEWFARDFNE
jgi:hypothetical protein